MTSHLQYSPPKPLIVVNDLNPRPWLAPLAGATLGYGISLLPGLFNTVALPAWSALTLLLGFVYLALLPGCRLVWPGLALAMVNISVALTTMSNGGALKAWLGLQTIIAAIWLLRRDQPEELSTAGLILGLCASATALMPYSI